MPIKPRSHENRQIYKKEFVFKNSTKAFICFALTNFDMLVSFHFISGPLLRICKWRGHQEIQLGGGEREKWELVWPRNVFLILGAGA
jgi:hypothetical protein